MFSRCCAVLLSTLLLNAHAWAQLQRSDTARKAERGEQPAAQTPPAETTAAEPTVEELLKARRTRRRGPAAMHRRAAPIAW